MFVRIRAYSSWWVLFLVSGFVEEYSSDACACAAVEVVGTVVDEDADAESFANVNFGLRSGGDCVSVFCSVYFLDEWEVECEPLACFWEPVCGS